MVSALAVVLCSSCDQQAERQLQTSVLGNYCEVTVLAYDGSDVHSDNYYSNVVISYEGGSGTNFGTYMVPQQGDVTVSWTLAGGFDYDGDYSETFNVGSAVKMTIVVRGSSAFANY